MGAGKPLLWARADTTMERLSDFDGPVRDGFAVDWPIRYKDIEPWYSYVEKFAGIAGSCGDGIGRSCLTVRSCPVSK